MARQTIAQQVTEDIATLQTSTTIAELRTWAETHGMDSRAAFPRFKTALLDHGIDYAAMRAGEQGDARETLVAAVTHTMTLYSDAKASKDRYGICTEDGTPVWHGRFFSNDQDYDGEQSSGELAAAKKAVWLAHKAGELVGAGGMKLALFVDAEWLTWANGGLERGGRALELRRAADRLGVVLEVRHVSGRENPADQWTIAKGFQRWQDADLRSLVTAVTETTEITI